MFGRNRPAPVDGPSVVDLEAQRKARDEKDWHEELIFVRGKIAEAITDRRRFVNISRYNHRYFVQAVVAVANEDAHVKDVQLHSSRKDGSDPWGGRYYTEQALLTLDFQDS